MNERARLRALDAGEVNDSVDDLWHIHLTVDSDEGNHSARVCVGERRRYRESYPTSNYSLPLPLAFRWASLRYGLWYVIAYSLWYVIAYGTLRPMATATYSYGYAYGYGA